jgi:uncharacterized membrane protein YoaK (UPF0700 family)
MLRHTGEKRSYIHNLRLAILLSTNAGFINAAGFLAFNVLTTNVTGHAALLAVDMATGQLRAAQMVMLWLFLFLAGAFFSSLYVSVVGRSRSFAYTIPMILIAGILLLVAVLGHTYDHSLRKTEQFAGVLLFAMGVQNALVSMISGSEVRTTHLTGMVTDLGIDLSGAALSRKGTDTVLRRRINLRLAIIGCFLSGGLVGGTVFLKNSFTAFYIPAAISIAALFYDYFRVKISRALHTNRLLRKK